VKPKAKCFFHIPYFIIPRVPLCTLGNFSAMRVWLRSGSSNPTNDYEQEKFTCFGDIQRTGDVSYANTGYTFFDYKNNIGDVWILL